MFTVGYHNLFGLPKQDILQRYIDRGDQLLRSDEDSAILVEMDPLHLAIESYRKLERRNWTHLTKDQDIANQ